MTAISLYAPPAKRHDHPAMTLHPAASLTTADRRADHAAQAGFEDLLVAVGQTRNRDAFIRLFEYFAPRVKSYLMKGGSSPALADELAQETMLSVWQRAESYDPAKASAATWIYTIARNKRIDAARRSAARGGHNTASIDQLYDVPDQQSLPPDAALTRAQDSQNIASALSALPEQQASLLYKSYFENKSHGDIAAETGIPLGTVKSRIRAALERLRGMLGAEAPL